MTIARIFACCVKVVRNNVLIRRVSATDKEFHFQNWFKARLEELGQNFEVGGRNSYPDFRMVAATDGYEVKGLAYPGRDASFDSNSQVPTGSHNGRTIYYVFGRYPKHPDGDSYPVLDLVLCHGDLLNADHEYVHENKSVEGLRQLRRYSYSRSENVRGSNPVPPPRRGRAPTDLDSSGRDPARARASCASGSFVGVNRPN